MELYEWARIRFKQRYPLYDSFGEFTRDKWLSLAVLVLISSVLFFAICCWLPVRIVRACCKVWEAIFTQYPHVIVDEGVHTKAK